MYIYIYAPWKKLVSYEMYPQTPFLLYVRMYICIRVYIYTYIYIHVHIHTCAMKEACFPCYIFSNTFLSLHMHVYIYTRIHIHIYIYTYMYRYMWHERSVCARLHIPPENLLRGAQGSRRVLDPCAPLLFNLYHYLEQNVHFG